MRERLTVDHYMVDKHIRIETTDLRCGSVDCHICCRTLERDDFLKNNRDWWYYRFFMGRHIFISRFASGDFEWNPSSGFHEVEIENRKEIGKLNLESDIACLGKHLIILDNHGKAHTYEWSSKANTSKLIELK